MHPVDEAAQHVGGRGELARIFEKSLSTIGQWKQRGVPIEYCARLERICPTVTRQRLRPHDWREIWPELAANDSKAVQEVAHG